MKPYCRQLHDSRLSEHFVKNVLNITSGSAYSKAIRIIAEAEVCCIAVENKDTLAHDNYRDPKYVFDEKRIELRSQILNELINLKRIDNDDKIKLGRGGALPPSGIAGTEKQAFIIIGLPAAGKSSVAHRIADIYNAIIIDSDFAKRKLPEFKMKYAGASLVHEESDLIVFGKEGYDELNLLGYCCLNGYNVVIPKIGHNSISVLELSMGLMNEWGYSVHLVLLSLDRQKATARAYRRFNETGRYVPLSLIFDWYSNEPILTYYRIRNATCFSSYGKISSDVDKDKPFILVEASKDNPANFYKPAV